MISTVLHLFRSSMQCDFLAHGHLALTARTLESILTNTHSKWPTLTDWPVEHGLLQYMQLNNLGSAVQQLVAHATVAKDWDHIYA